MAIEKTGTSALCVLMGVIASGCMSTASDEEINKMCNVLITVQGEIGKSSVDQLVTAAKEQISRKEKHLKEWKARDLQALDDELNAKLAETDTDNAEAKTKLTAEYTKKKEITTSKYDPDIAKIPEEMKAVLAEAQSTVAKNKTALDKAVKDCVEAAKKEGVSQKTAQCRIKAKTTDEYWKNCW